MRFSHSLLLFGAFIFASAHFSPSVELARSSRSLSTRDLPEGTCNADTPCANSACCGTTGLCGYSPTECGSGNCTSNCDAKAECGQYGVEGKQTCPLNVCCSKFGYVLILNCFRNIHLLIHDLAASVVPRAYSVTMAANLASEAVVLSHVLPVKEAIVLASDQSATTSRGRTLESVRALLQRI